MLGGAGERAAISPASHGTLSQALITEQPGKCLGFTATGGYNLHHVRGVKMPLHVPITEDLS